MIRFGMNKKSKEPVNSELPFYYTKDGFYTPVKDLFICGPSRSFYRKNSFGRRIVWMETERDVLTYIPFPLPLIKYTIHIDKDIVINENEKPCCIEDGKGIISYCNEFFIDSPCMLVYDLYASEKTIYIEAYGDVTILE